MNKRPSTENIHISKARYFGILVTSGNAQSTEIDRSYIDIEEFALESTLYATSSRSIEGMLTWLKRYGSILSPSKLRRMLEGGVECDRAVLGAYLSFVEKYSSVNFAIVKKLCTPSEKHRALNPMIPMSAVKVHNQTFKAWGIIIPDYLCDENKFLERHDHLLARCIEIKNRVMMGSVVHADLNSLISKSKGSMTKYQMAKKINNLRASVNKALALFPSMDLEP